MNIIEQSGGIRPETAYGLDRHGGGERAPASDKAILDTADATVAMARRAILGELLSTLGDRTAAGGSPLPSGRTSMSHRAISPGGAGRPKS